MLEFHRKLLGDRVRNDAFQEALRRSIQPGVSVVADIGSGTGFLSFLARRLGARECTLYEQGDVLELSKRLAQENAIDHLRFVHRHSMQVGRPTRADIVVAEVLGNYALEEHIIETMNDARERYLRPEGVLIPGRLRQYACPVTSPRLTREIDTWGIGYGLQYGAARNMGYHNAYVKTVTAEDLLGRGGDAQQYDAINFSVSNQSRRTATVQWKLREDAAVYGYAVWWEAELVPGVELSTSPLNPPTHWEQIFLPFPAALPCQRDDVLLFTLASDTRSEVGVNVTWRLQLFREGKEVEGTPTMDMRKGLLN